jgi:hypothetical protein
VSKVCLHHFIVPQLRAAHELCEQANRFGIAVIKQTPNGLLEMVGLFLGVEFAIAATLRTRLSLGVAIRAFDLGNVDNAIARFFWLFIAKGLDGVEKPQWIFRTIGVADEPLAKACIMCAGTSSRVNIPTAKAGRAIVLLDSTTMTSGTDRAKSTRRASFATQETSHFVEREIALALGIGDAIGVPGFATLWANHISHLILLFSKIWLCFLMPKALSSTIAGQGDWDPDSDCDAQHQALNLLVRAFE